MRWWLSWLIVAWLPAAASAAQTEQRLTFEQILRTPAQALAERLLGAEQANDVERFEAERDPMLPNSFEVRLYNRPVALSEDICGQTVHRVRLHEPPIPGTQVVGGTLRVGSVYDHVIIALAPGCRLAAGQRFAHVNPGMDRETAAEALRMLARARAAAAVRRRLPFRLSCRDELDQGACRGGARRTLARLPTELTWLVERDEENSGFSLVVSRPSGPMGPIWDVTIGDFGTPRARVSMVWKVPAPF